MSRQANPVAIGGFVLGAVVIIVASILVFGSGTWFQDKTRVVRALTVRIVLSFVLFSIIMAAYFFGWIEPNAVA